MQDCRGTFEDWQLSSNWATWAASLFILFAMFNFYFRHVPHAQLELGSTYRATMLMLDWLRCQVVCIWGSTQAQRTNKHESTQVAQLEAVFEHSPLGWQISRIFRSHEGNYLGQSRSVVQGRIFTEFADFGCVDVASWNVRRPHPALSTQSRPAKSIFGKLVLPSGSWTSVGS